MTYTNTRAHLIDELERVSQILEHWDADAADMPSEPQQTDDSVDLAQHPEGLELNLPDEAATAIENRADEIATRCAETDESVSLRLRTLAERFGLSRNHLDVFLLAAAPDLDPDFEDSFRVLQNDTGAMNATVGFIASLFATNESSRFAATALVGPGSPLRQHGLIELSEPVGASRSHRRRLLSVDPRLLSFLEGHRDLDPVLNQIATLETPTLTPDDLQLEPSIRRRLQKITNTESSTSSRIHYFYGPEGAEKQRAVRSLTDQQLLRADLEAVLQNELLDRFRREALLQDCPVHLTNVTEATTQEGRTDDSEAEDTTNHLSIDEVVKALAPLEHDLFLTGGKQWTPASDVRETGYVLIEFPKPGFDLREELWREHTDILGDDVDPTTLANTFELTQGEILDAIATAHALTDTAGGAKERQQPTEINREAVIQGCKAQSAQGLDDLAEQMVPNADWDDIVLPSDTERQLKEVAARVKYRGTVYEDWGFEERFSRGTGVVTLFAGPSGTGKTMAAEIIANDAGMDIYKIDLSSVVSKYIGETEENMERIFDAARDSNAILLFDEADAVFGQRAGVSDATDRYANAEVNYLLQRIETYDGIVLMTTNYESNIDDAFMRRIHQTVSFQRPEKAARKAIWQVTFPEETPTEDIDYEFLAQLELTGGNIRNVAQTAAVLGAEDGMVVRMRHIVKAIQREYDKLDKMLDPSDFGEYKQLLRTEGNDSTTRSSDPVPTAPDRTPEQSPDAVVEEFFDMLDSGDRSGVQALYHSDTDDAGFSTEELRFLKSSTLEIASDFERIIDNDNRVVLQFVQELNDERTELEYELRTDEDEWRIWSVGEAKRR